MANVALNYSFSRPIGVAVSGFDLTPCFKAVSWSLAPHEPEQSLVWQAEMTLALTIAAQQAGITANDLDPIASPVRWASGVGRVVIDVGGFTSLVFRVDSWRYDPITATASGSLSQQIDLYDQALPDISPELIYTSPIEKTDTRLVVQNLLTAVANLTTQSFAFDSGSIQALSRYDFYGMRSTRNPLAEVQTFAKCDWAWLVQDLTTEQVRVQKLDYYNAPVVFAKPRLLAEVTPNLDYISFSAPKVVVHGSADMPDSCPGGNVPSNVNDNGLPREQITEQKEAIGLVFPSRAPSTSPVTTQRKIVKYYYLTDSVRRSWPVPVYPIRTPPLAMDERTGLYATEVEVYEPLGKLFPRLGVNTFLTISSRVVETATYKAVWRPLGVLFPALAPNTRLVLANLERLETEYIGDRGLRIGRLPGGVHGCIDSAEAERPEVVALKLAPKLFRAEVGLTRPYTPALDYPLVYNMGYCPSQQSAELVAARLAVREASRRVADTVRMPLPREWLGAGCPHFARCQIGTNSYFVDAPVATVEADEEGRVTASLEFTGCLLGTLPDLPPILPSPFDPSLSTDLTQTWPDTIPSTAGVPLSYQL